MMSAQEIVPGRNCEGCTLCCKLLGVAELDVAPLIWCPHCKAKAGCSIYEQRPTECRQFVCEYLRDPAIGNHWKPSKCKMVVVVEEFAHALVVHVDPDRPDAWREAPFYGQLRQWAQAAADKHWQLIVWQGSRKIIIAPQELRAGTSIARSTI
jgi:hypothetical protein